jgi:hypothetical protein
MADVTGQFGDQEVVLNNAATEATLKQLVGVMSAMAKKAGVEIKSDKELDASLKRLGKQTEAGVRSGRKFQRSQDKLGKSANEASESLDDAAGSADTFGAAIKDNLQFIGKLGQTAQKALNYIGDTLSSIANMGDSITSATDTLGNVPLVGDAIKGVYGPVAGAVEQLQTQFQSAASVGANFGGNIAEFSRSAGNAGMTMEQFSGVVQKNAQNLVFLGGSTADGAKRLADMGKDIRKSQVGDELARLGYSTVDINNGLAEYSGRLARNGRAETLNNKQLIALTGTYMKNLDAVSKLTGKSKETLQAEQDARQADAQYRIMMSKLGPEQQAEMEKLMDSIPKAHQTGLKEILATGTATSKEGVKAMAFLKESGGEAQKIYQKIQSGQQLEEGFASDFYDTYAAEAKKFAESPVGQTLGKFDDEMNDFYVAAADVANRNKSLADIQKEIEAQLKKNRDDAAKGVGDIIDPAAIKTFKENIAQASTEFTTALGSIDLKPLESVFTQALDAAKEYLVPALKKAAENFPLFLTAMGGANLALKALELAAGAAATAQMLGLRRGPGAGASTTSGNKPKPKPGAGAAKGILRRFGPLGLAYGLYEGYQSYSAIDESLEAGEITENQATVQKSESVGETVGGTGGAMAGAMAGAAIGSVVPVVGTAIGGLIGGAIGWWAGSSAGGAIGEKIGEGLVGEDTIRDVEDKIANLNAAIAEDSWSSVGFSAEDEKRELEQLQKDLALLKQKKAEQEQANTTADGVPKNPDGTLSDDPSAGTDETPSTNATDAQKTLEQQAAEAEKKKAEEERKRIEEEKKKQEALEGVPVSESSQKTPDQLLSELNSSMNQLVQLATTQTMLAKKQLGVTGENVGDLYGAV